MPKPGLAPPDVSPLLAIDAAGTSDHAEGTDIPAAELEKGTPLEWRIGRRGRSGSDYRLVRHHRCEAVKSAAK
jgi:hypothetical protein